jgi:ABC-2 type transport system ATP-binding protein
MPEKFAIQVNGLTKIYPPDLRAVDGLDLEVKNGEIMALLGPNGAGKSTTIRVLSTLSGFDSGRALVGGIDVDTDPEGVRRTIGVVAQKTGVDYFLTGRENMTLQGQMYRMKKADIRARIEELAKYFELEQSLDKTVASYSGGMARKLDIASALIHRPRILYLDEPTLGLDIRSRKILWRHIEELNRNFGLTILLTTHYLEEADKLAHRVAIINAGKIRIIGTPDELKNGIHGDSVVLTFETAGTAERAYAERLQQTGLSRDAVWEGDNLHLYVDNGAASIPQIIELAGPANVHVKSLSYARPTLDDVFLKYTGASMQETKEEEGEQWWTQWAGKGGGRGDWKKMAAKWGYVESEDGEGEWQGNEWVDKDGNPRAPAGTPGDSAQSSASAPASSPEMNEDAGTAWQGNEWVDAEGRPRDAQAAGAWKGNQWVDEHGKPRKPDEPSASVAASGGASASGDQQPEWQGNRWVDKQGHQIGDWGNAPDWKGNDWVDEDGKPRSDWNTSADSAPAAPSPADSSDSASAQSGEGRSEWQGNRWVDAEGHQVGDWGNAPDWKGNEWVDEEGKPRGDWSRKNERS